MRPMRPFNFNTAAELFPAAIRTKKRAGFAYRRFGTAAEAVRFAMEELPADSLNGAYLQVEEARFDQSGIRCCMRATRSPCRAASAPPRKPTATRTRPNSRHFCSNALGRMSGGVFHSGPRSDRKLPPA